MKTQTKKSKNPSINLSRGQNNLSDVHAMLEDFRTCVKKGFSHDNWTLAVRIYHALSTTLFAKEREILSETIRLSYQQVNPEFVDAQLERVKLGL